jgi:glycosyltransferase involved in cell wall biosynthesis
VSRLAIAMPTSSFLPNLGGAEVGLHNIASRLAARGHRPVVMAPRPHVVALREGAWDLPYEVVPFPPKIFGVMGRWPGFGMWLLDRFFARQQHRYDFDVWHGTMGYPVGVALAHYAIPRRIPHVVRCAGEDIQRTPEIGYGARLDPRVDVLVRDWLPRTQRLVAISQTVADEYRALGVSEARISAIPNGVDLERFAGEWGRVETRRRLGISPEETVFLAVGRNHRKKNLVALVSGAAALIRRGRADFRIIVAGSGCDELQAVAAAQGIGERFIALPEVRPERGATRLPADELVRLYKAADVFVFPSLVETFGIVLVEAMAAGLPVITTDGPGCRDIIRSGTDGLMVPVTDDGTALGESMTRMLDLAVRAEYVEKSKSRAKGFSWDTVVDLYLTLYRDAIASACAASRQA